MCGWRGSDHVPNMKKWLTDMKTRRSLSEAAERPVEEMADMAEQPSASTFSSLPFILGPEPVEAFETEEVETGVKFDCLAKDEDTTGQMSDVSDLSKQAEREVCCPGGHALQKYITYCPGFTCDLCTRTLGQGVETMFCRACNFDICQECALSLRDGGTCRASEPQQPAAQSVPAVQPQTYLVPPVLHLPPPPSLTPFPGFLAPSAPVAVGHQSPQLQTQFMHPVMPIAGQYVSPFPPFSPVAQSPSMPSQCQRDFVSSAGLPPCARPAPLPSQPSHFAFPSQLPATPQHADTSVSLSSSPLPASSESSSPKQMEPSTRIVRLRWSPAGSGKPDGEGCKVEGYRLWCRPTVAGKVADDVEWQVLVENTGSPVPWALCEVPAEASLWEFSAESILSAGSDQECDPACTSQPECSQVRAETEHGLDAQLPPESVPSRSALRKRDRSHARRVRNEQAQSARTISACRAQPRPELLSEAHALLADMLCPAELNPSWASSSTDVPASVDSEDPRADAELGAAGRRPAGHRRVRSSCSSFGASNMSRVESNSSRSNSYSAGSNGGGCDGFARSSSSCSPTASLASTRAKTKRRCGKRMEPTGCSGSRPNPLLESSRQAASVSAGGARCRTASWPLAAEVRSPSAGSLELIPLNGCLPSFPAAPLREPADELTDTVPRAVESPSRHEPYQESGAAGLPDGSLDDVFCRLLADALNDSQVSL